MTAMTWAQILAAERARAAGHSAISEQAARAKLPDRRPHMVSELRWLDRLGAPRACLLGVGFDREGRIREAFVSGLKTGSDIEALVQDGCVALSVAMQCGAEASALAHHLGRQGAIPDSAAASLLGLIAKALPEIEAHEGPRVRALTEGWL